LSVLNAKRNKYTGVHFSGQSNGQPYRVSVFLGNSAQLLSPFVKEPIKKRSCRTTAGKLRALSIWNSAMCRLSGRDELLEREAFDTLLNAKVLIERWRQHSNTLGHTVP